jgi:hypothetical protein
MTEWRREDNGFFDGRRYVKDARLGDERLIVLLGNDETTIAWVTTWVHESVRRISNNRLEARHSESAKTYTTELSEIDLTHLRLHHVHFLESHPEWTQADQQHLESIVSELCSVPFGTR